MSEIQVEVVFALPAEQFLQVLTVEAGTQAGQAVMMSKIPARYPQFNFNADLALGIFGRQVAPDYVLAANERLEIYRPLTADPKQNRRLRSVQDHNDRRR